MATVIDQLVVELGLDPSKFKKAVSGVVDDQKKLKESSKKTAQDIETGTDKAANSINKLRGEVLSLFAVFTAGRGIKDFVTSIVQTDAGMGRMAYTLDSTVQKLSTWAGAGSMVGASAQEIIGNFQSLTSQFQMFSLTGQSAVLPFFRALGVDISDGNGRMRDMGAVFLDLADKFHAMDPARAKAFGDAMGLSPGMINLLIKGRAAVEGYLATAKKYAPTEKDVKAAYDLQQAWNLMSMSSTRMGRSFLTDLSPSLKKIMYQLTEMADFLSAHPAILSPLMTGLAGIVGLLSLPIIVGTGSAFFGGLINGVRILMGVLPALFLNLAVLTDTLLPSLSTAFLATGAAIEGSLGGVGLAALAIAGLITEIHLLISDMDSAERSAARMRYDQARAKAPAGDWRRDPLNAVYRDDGHYERVNGRAVFIKNKPGAGAPQAGPSPDALANVIGGGEGGYDSVNLGQRGGYQPSKRDLSDMTVNDVMAAQQRGEFNAAGKYQVVKTTLPGAVQALGLRGDEKFDQKLQDRIFKDYLITTKQPAIGDYLSGKSNDLHAAMLAASKEWASVADPDTGQSHYAGVANNKASVSSDRIAGALQAGRAATAQAAPALSADALASALQTSRAANLQAAATPSPGLSLSPGQLAAANSNTWNQQSHSELHIGEMNINTQATDATGVAKDMSGALSRQLTAQQGNYGPS